MNTPSTSKTSHSTPGLFLLLGLVLSGTVLGGCSSSALPDHSAPRTGWLEQTGFFDRRAWPSALLHLTRREIGSSGRLTGLLGKVEGLRVQVSPFEGFGIEQLRSEGDQSCQVHVYMNGRRLHRSPTAERISLDEIFPKRVIDGLEYHVAPDGPIFEEDGCGSLLLWSGELRMSQDRALQSSIEGRVVSSSPDSVVRVELEPVGTWQVTGPEGAFSFQDLLPGEYELVFNTPSGPITRLKARVFAFRASRIDLEIGKIPGKGG